MSAREPWAGYVRYDESLNLIAHLSRFSKPGWPKDAENSNQVWLAIPGASKGYAGDYSTNEHLTNEAGRPSYMTLVAPDKSDFTVVAVNNSPKPLTYKIKAEGLALGDDKTMEIWQTRADEYMAFKGEVQPDEQGYYRVSVEPGAMASFTSLDMTGAGLGDDSSSPLRLPENTALAEKAVLDTDERGKMGEGNTPVTDDAVLYADDFEYTEEADVPVYTKQGTAKEMQDYLASRGGEPRYMMDTHGAFVVETEENGNHRLGQILDSRVSEWNGGDPETIVGDHRWMNYRASVDVQAENGYALLGIRQQRGMNSTDSGYNLKLQGADWQLRKGASVLKSGSLQNAAGKALHLTLEGRENMISAYADGQLLATIVDEESPYLSGRVFLGSDWKKTWFDNLKIETIPGYVPYAGAFFDDHDDELQYKGAWSLKGPGLGSADNWYRTTAVNEAFGEGNEFSFEGSGTGFMLVGENGGGAVLDVYDGERLLAKGMQSKRSAKRYSTLKLDGLTAATHHYRVVLRSGTLTLDGVYLLGEPVPGGGKAALSKLTEEIKALEESAYTADSWALLAEKLQSAESCLAKETVTQAEIDRAWSELYEAREALMSMKEAVEVVGELPKLAVMYTYQSISEVLPEELEVRLADGSTEQKAIRWTLKTAARAYQRNTALGSIEGSKLKLELPVELIPNHLVYYIDSISTDESKNETSEVYAAVKDFAGDELLNQRADQLYTEGQSWGLEQRDAGTKGYTGTGDKDLTGLYGARNQSGETLSYQLTLEAGEYELSSGHKEWWPGQNRPMNMSLWYDGKEHAAGSSSDGNYQASVRFRLNEAQTVRYAITATGSQAPVISWLAVRKITEGEPVSLRVRALPEKTLYLPGEELALKGLSVVSVDEAGTETALDSASFSVEGFDADSPGEKTLSVTYESPDGKTLRTSFKVYVAREIIKTERIRITKNPSKMEYLVNEDFDPSGMEVIAYQTIVLASASEAEAADTADAADTAEAEDTAEAVDTAEAMDTVKAAYRTVETRLNINELEYSYDFSEAGLKTVRVSYIPLKDTEQRCSAELTVRVKAEDTEETPDDDGFETTSIFIKRKPDKLLYLTGEELDLSGIEVCAKLKALKGTRQKEVKLDAEALEKVYDFSAAGESTVYLYYYADNPDGEAKLKTSFKVQVAWAESGGEDMYTEALKIARLPDKLSYHVGDKLDLTGIEVQLVRRHAQSGEKEILPLTDYSVNLSRFMKPGREKIIISFAGIDKERKARLFEDSFYVKVEAQESNETGTASGSDDAAEAYDAASEAGGSYAHLRNNSPYRDAVKGYVSPLDGVLTGTAAGYARWIRDENGWWLRLPSGKYPLGRQLSQKEAAETALPAFSPTGVKHEHVQLQPAWEKVNGRWFAFDERGYLLQGFCYDPALQGWFYLDEKLGMLLGWQQLAGKWYYFNPVSDGRQGMLLTDTLTPDGFRLDRQGVWIK